VIEMAKPKIARHGSVAISSRTIECPIHQLPMTYKPESGKFKCTFEGCVKAARVVDDQPSESVGEVEPKKIVRAKNKMPTTPLRLPASSVVGVDGLGTVIPPSTHVFDGSRNDPTHTTFNPQHTVVAADGTPISFNGHLAEFTVTLYDQATKKVLRQMPISAFLESMELDHGAGSVKLIFDAPITLFS
jgi:hypothetical protein